MFNATDCSASIGGDVDCVMDNDDDFTFCKAGSLNCLIVVNSMIFFSVIVYILGCTMIS